MQRFPCPFCGLRDEREFRYGGEAGKARPDTRTDVSDETWRDYLFANKNPMGQTREIWVHLTCQEYFILERDTVSMEVTANVALRKDNT